MNTFASPLFLKVNSLRKESVIAAPIHQWHITSPKQSFEESEPMGPREVTTLDLQDKIQLSVDS